MRAGIHATNYDDGARPIIYSLTLKLQLAYDRQSSPWTCCHLGAILESAVGAVAAVIVGRPAAWWATRMPPALVAR